METVIEKYVNNTKSNPDVSTSTISDSVGFSLMHLESTSCEEYELVQSLFHKVIREVRREREAHQISNPLQISEESSQKNKLKSNTSTLTKRTKSPKQNNSIYEHSSQSAANVNSTGNGMVSSQSAGNTLNSTGAPTVSNSAHFISSNKEASIKKNKFQFFNKILNKNSSNNL